ncbi:MAG: hypothetical protein NVSMB19_13010 [Vulcanimicrobiaceae bacterium]
MRRFALGLAGGVVVGYALVRAREAVVATRTPPEPIEPDPAAYGKLRRALMLAGIGRSLATLAFAAYVLGPRLEPAAGAPESRRRRLALLAAGIVGSTVLDLPGDFVEGLALERRYGLSKQHPRAWLAERAKGLGLSVAIALPLVELLTVAIARAPRRWPLAATLGTFPLLILANVVAPTYIAPLFNKFEALDGDLARDIRALAARYGAGDATILRVDMSRQTEKANAYVTGLFGTKRIVVGDTLLGHFEPNETLFVVAHELGHYVARDVWRGVALAMAAAGVVFFGGRAIAERPGRQLATSAGLLRLGFAFSLLGTLTGPLLAAFSRDRERAADRFAIEATHDAPSGAAAFRRLRDRNLAEDEQPKWMEVLFASHPSLRSRIERLETSAVTSR